MDDDGSNPQRITDLPGQNDNPRWSLDGSMIVFVSTMDGNEEVYIMNNDGTGLQNITRHAADDDHPDWSPVVP